MHPLPIEAQIKATRALTDKPYAINLFIEAEHPKTVAAKLVRELAASSLRLSMAEGDMVDGAVMVGQCASRLNEVRKAADIINSSMSEARALLAGMASVLL